jgi:preprotein translocase SecE subunit
MAVAVKNTPEVASASLLDRMAAASLAGTAYALGTLGITFYLIPSLWGTLGWTGNAAWIVRDLIQLVVLVGLINFGVRLLKPKAAAGTRAGIFLGIVGFLVILLLTRWASLWFEYGAYQASLYSPIVGAILTAIVGLALVFVAGRFFLRPGFERFLVRLEEQGWFSAKPYKPLQGVRVRRGTIFGILVLVGAGIWTLLAHNTLRKGPPDWQMNIPFTGRVAIQSAGDAKAELAKRFPDWEARLQEGTLVVDRETLKEINQAVDPATHVKIFTPGGSDYATNEIVDRSAFNEVTRKLKESNEPLPTTVAPEPAGGPLAYRSLTLLPSVQFTVPLLLLAASLWLAYRVVNMPAFADFLIATEAEMNKVSWTTQKRLVQDTIVVLVTVILMAFYLFAMDQSWRVLLSWKPIGVLQVPDEQSEQNTNVEQRPF